MVFVVSHTDRLLIKKMSKNILDKMSTTIRLMYNKKMIMKNTFCNEFIVTISLTMNFSKSFFYIFPYLRKKKYR